MGSIVRLRELCEKLPGQAIGQLRALHVKKAGRGHACEGQLHAVWQGARVLWKAQ